MPFIYIGIKLALYTLWCWYGIRLLSPSRIASPLRAFGYALARLVLGFVLGYVLVLLLNRLMPSDYYSRLGFNPKLFLIGLLPLRWLVWSAVSYLIQPPSGGLYLFLIGAGKADRLWRLGGVGLSFLADVLVLVGLLGLGGIVF